MATRKSTTQPVKLTAAEAREKVEELQYKDYIKLEMWQT